jgi:hypothetical protein
LKSPTSPREATPNVAKDPAESFSQSQASAIRHEWQELGRNKLSGLTPVKRTSIVLLAAAVVLTAARLWLVANQPILVIPRGSFDDVLFVKLARNLSNGAWLGPYDNRTLIKGPFYPMWIAAAHLVGIPLPLAQELLYVTACAVLVLALRPTLGRGGALLLVYSVLLFQPAGYTIQATQRILREGVYPALSLLTIAGLLGLALRTTRPVREQIPWALALGLGLGAMSITREERIWIVPCLILIAAWTGLQSWRKPLRVVRAHAAMWAVALGLAVVPSLIICSLNWRHYGLFAITELDTVEFRAAYGALSRVKPPQWIINVPVTRATREAIYRVSPAFAELESCFQSGRGRDWSHQGSKNEGEPNELIGAWFLWALRDCVADAGYYRSGRFPGQFYERLADEVNDACAAGQLECYARRASLTPVAHSAYLAPVFHNVLRATWRLVSFEECDSRPRQSPDGAITQMFLEMTGGRLYDPARGKLRRLLLEGITFLFRLITPIASVLALLGYAYETWFVAARRKVTAQWIVSTALVAAGGTRLIMLAILEAAWSFPALRPQYLSPIYPLALAFVVLKVMQAATCWQPERARIA